MNISLRVAIVCMIAVLSFSGCKKTSTTASSPAASASTAATPEQFHHPDGGTTPLTEIKYFKGSIGTSLDLQMKLNRSGDQLTGSYFYQKVGTKIDLKGTVDRDGNLMLEEFDPNGKQTGLFKGFWKADEDGLIAISGNWSKPPSEKGGEKKTAFSIHEEPISLSGGAEVINKQIKESNKKLKYEVEAQYPQLSGGSNPNFEKFNETVRSQITNKTAGFKKDMAGPDQADVPADEQGNGSDISIGYTLALVQDDLASIDFDVSSYFAGAAHPNSYSFVINYDLKNGRQLKLSDVFKPGAKYLQTLSSFAISDLKKQSKAGNGSLDDSLINEGAGPATKNFESWLIKKRGLGINFDPYAVGPYAAGPQFVLVPYSTLKDLINPDGPLGQFVK